MNFNEYAGKALLRQYGIATPDGRVVRTAAEARDAAAEIGRCVVKAQVPTGRRGKAGGIKLAATPDEAKRHAEAILELEIGGFAVEALLIDPQISIARELYVAVLNDPDSKGPVMLFSADGGMDIEDIIAERADALVRLPVDIRRGPDVREVQAAIGRQAPELAAQVALVMMQLYAAYAAADAELLEINPLVVTGAGTLVALDCKLTVDDSALPRQQALAATGCAEKLSALEKRAAAMALKFIELDGEVGVLANGAGLTMTTMDAIRHFGGRPANFMEIGGDSYTKAKPALELVLGNRQVKCLLVNFCGAFARTDVMAEGVIKAWRDLKPDIPIIFTIHGTGEDEAIAMVRTELGIEPYDLMDDAVKAAVEAAR